LFQIEVSLKCYNHYKMNTDTPHDGQADSENPPTGDATSAQVSSSAQR